MLVNKYGSHMASHRSQTQGKEHMTTHEFVWTFILGTVFGWGMHSVILQIAYRFGIVEYKGRWAEAKSKEKNA
jgi:hypothetical protein